MQQSAPGLLATTSPEVAEIIRGHSTNTLSPWEKARTSSRFSYLGNLSRATLDAADIPESDERSTGLRMRYETGKDLLAAAVAEAQKEAKTTWKDNDNKRKTQAKKRYSDLTTTDGVVRAWEEAPLR